MCNVPACLDGETKARIADCLLSPTAELVTRRQAIKASIDLNGWEMLGIVGQVIANRKFGRVKTSNPIWINPAGGTDPNHSALLARDIIWIYPDWVGRSEEHTSELQSHS